MRTRRLSKQGTGATHQQRAGPGRDPRGARVRDLVVIFADDTPADTSGHWTDVLSRARMAEDEWRRVQSRPTADAWCVSVEQGYSTSEIIGGAQLPASVTTTTFRPRCVTHATLRICGPRSSPSRTAPGGGSAAACGRAISERASGILAGDPQPGDDTVSGYCNRAGSSGRPTAFRTGLASRNRALEGLHRRPRLPLQQFAAGRQVLNRSRVPHEALVVAA